MMMKKRRFKRPGRYLMQKAGYTKRSTSAGRWLMALVGGGAAIFALLSAPEMFRYMRMRRM